MTGHGVSWLYLAFWPAGNVSPAFAPPVESVSQSCPHCLGTGRVRSVIPHLANAAHYRREAARQAGKDVTIFVHPEVALYVLSQKRASCLLESQFGITILVKADTSLSPSEHR